MRVVFLLCVFCTLWPLIVALISNMMFRGSEPIYRYSAPTLTHSGKGLYDTYTNEEEESREEQKKAKKRSLREKFDALSELFKYAEKFIPAVYPLDVSAYGMAFTQAYMDDLRDFIPKMTGQSWFIAHWRTKEKLKYHRFMLACSMRSMFIDVRQFAPIKPTNLVYCASAYLVGSDKTELEKYASRVSDDESKVIKKAQTLHTEDICKELLDDYMILLKHTTLSFVSTYKSSRDNMAKIEREHIYGDVELSVADDTPNKNMAQKYNAKVKKLMESTIMPQLKDIETAFTTIFPHDEKFDMDEHKKQCRENVDKLYALRKSLADVQSEFIVYMPLEAPSDLPKAPSIKYWLDRISHPKFQKQFDVILALFDDKIRSLVDNRIRRFFVESKNTFFFNLEASIQELNSFGNELIVFLTSTDVNFFSSSVCSMDATTEERERVTTDHLRDAVAMLESLSTASVLLPRAVGSVFASSYIMSAFEARSSKQESNLAALRNETVHLSGHCWSHMFHLIERIQKERDSIICNAAKTTLRDPDLENEIFIFRRNSNTLKKMDDCSIFYGKFVTNFYEVPTKTNYSTVICEEMRRDWDQNADIFRSSLDMYPKIEDLQLKKTYLINEEGLGESDYAKRVRRYNADIGELFKKMPWNEVKKLLSEATKISYEFNLPKCRLAIGHVEQLLEALDERQTTYKIFRPMTADSEHLKGMEHRFYDVAQRQLNQQIQYLTIFRTNSDEIENLNVSTKAASNTLFSKVRNSKDSEHISTFMKDLNDLGMKFATGEHLNKSIYWADESLETSAKFCETVGGSSGKAKQMASGYLNAALDFTHVFTADISRRSWRFQTQMDEDLKTIRVKYIEAPLDDKIGEFFDSAGWINGKTCENFHLALLEQMDELTLAVASKGLYAPIFPDYASPEKISDTFKGRLGAAVNAAIGHSEKLNSKDVPIKIGVFKSSRDAFEQIEDFIKSIDSAGPVGGATVNSALKRVIVFLQLINGLVSNQLDHCEGFPVSVITDTQIKSLKKVASGEAVTANERMLEYIGMATHLDKYDKEALEAELKSSNSAFISSVERMLLSQERTKSKSKRLANFSKNILYNVTPLKSDSALEYCERINESLRNHQESMDSLLLSAAVHVPSHSTNGILAFEAFAILFRDSDKLRRHLHELWTSILELIMRSLSLFHGEKEILPSKIMSPNDFQQGSFATIDAFWTALQVRMGRYFSEIRRVVEPMQPLQVLIKRAAVEIRDKSADQGTVEIILLNVLRSMLERMGFWVRVSVSGSRTSRSEEHIKIDDVKTEIKKCLAKNKVAYNNPEEPQPNIEALVGVLTTCTEPIFSIIQSQAIVGDKIK